ncbi:hypothetical protein I4F81_010426 [Pyropia yezoensis]|uniref:Uncharacterized protein n=1 Tax=Pyropia yezoensis TaxID=2788 RepID=A0ACC3CCQ0_PYRYE|nr:hypothetical protein I4F81_010426 [Neopyropia yezoensis]
MEASGTPPLPTPSAAVPDAVSTAATEGSPSSFDEPPPPPSLPELPLPAKGAPAAPTPTAHLSDPPEARSPTVLAAAIQRVDSLTVEAVAALSSAVQSVHSPDVSSESLGEALPAAPLRPRPRRGGGGGAWPSRPPVPGRLPVVGEEDEQQAGQEVPAAGSTAADGGAGSGGAGEPSPVASSPPPPPPRAPPLAAAAAAGGGSPGHREGDPASVDEELVAALAGMKASPLAARTADALVHAVRRVDSMTPATAEEVEAALGPRPAAPRGALAGDAATAGAGGGGPGSSVGSRDGGGSSNAVVGGSAGGGGCGGGGGGGGGVGVGGRLPPKPPSAGRPGHRRGDTLVRAIAAADDVTLRAAAAVANAVVRVDTEEEGLAVGDTAVADPPAEGAASR